MVLSTFWLWMPGVILGKHSYQINVNVCVPTTVLSYESCYTIPGIKSFPLCIEIHLSSKRKQLSMDQSSFREHKKLHIERRYERNWEIVPVKSWQGIFCKFVSAIAGHALSSCHCLKEFVSYFIMIFMYGNYQSQWDKWNNVTTWSFVVFHWLTVKFFHSFFSGNL